MAAYQRGDYATTIRELRPLAEQGVAEAQFLLGVMYDKGQGVPQDYAEAVSWQRQRPGLTGSGYRGRANIGCPKVWGSRERRRPEFEEQSDLLPTYPLARFLL